VLVEHALGRRWVYLVNVVDHDQEVLPRRPLDLLCQELNAPKKLRDAPGYIFAHRSPRNILRLQFGGE
jgi:hypothetical protein